MFLSSGFAAGLTLADADFAAGVAFAGAAVGLAGAGFAAGVAGFAAGVAGFADTVAGFAAGVDFAGAVVALAGAGFAAVGATVSSSFATDFSDFGFWERGCLSSSFFMKRLPKATFLILGTNTSTNSVAVTNTNSDMKTIRLPKLFPYRYSLHLLSLPRVELLYFLS